MTDSTIRYSGTGGTVMALANPGAQYTIDSIPTVGPILGPWGIRDVRARTDVTSEKGRGANGNRTRMARHLAQSAIASRKVDQMVERGAAPGRTRGQAWLPAPVTRSRLQIRASAASATSATGEAFIVEWSRRQAAADAEAGRSSWFLDLRSLPTHAEGDMTPERAAALVLASLKTIERMRDRGFGDESGQTWDGMSVLIA